jgi:hypothetical protein
MAEHFKYYPSDTQTVAPWNARYSYPSQANKSTKSTPRIPPKNGSAFEPGQIMRLEFPAQSYVNPLNTVLEFDVVLFGPTNSGPCAVRFQNNIQSIFSRVRLLYGSTPQEDLLQYGLLVRCLTEFTASSTTQTMDRSAITDGIGGTMIGPHGTTLGAGVSAAASNAGVTYGGVGAWNFTVPDVLDTLFKSSMVQITGSPVTGLNGIYTVALRTNNGATTTVTVYTGSIGAANQAATVIEYMHGWGNTNVRQSSIQGLEKNFNGDYLPFQQTDGDGAGTVPNGPVAQSLPGGVSAKTPWYSVRRYTVNLALGILTQDKLIPTQFMAAQLAIEITLAPVQDCLYQSVGYATNTVPPSYSVGNIALIPEMIDFDDSYDEQFLKGLESAGIPLKFSSWHYFQFTTQGSSYVQYQISERSRSVKGLFAVQRRNPSSLTTDSHACFYDSNPASGITDRGSTMQEYQVRIGGRYFPASPVQCSANVGNTVSNGGAEAYFELEKFLNIVGEYRLPSSATPLNWAVPAIVNQYGFNLLSEHDFSFSTLGYSTFGIPNYHRVEAGNCSFVGNTPSSMFCTAINFETSNGVEISGLNAEEQSDISLNIRWSNNQASGFSVEVFTHVDLMWVLRPNNYIDLIQ